jgi:tetratricopeptide (TPR) repeat protein
VRPLRITIALFITICTLACAVAALADLVVANDAKNELVRLHVARGIIKFIKGDMAGARAHFDEAIRIDPKTWSAYYNRATIFCNQKDWEPALRDVNEAMRINPKFLRTAILRSQINYQLGRYSETLAELNHLISTIRMTDETSTNAYNGRAWLRATCPNAAFRDGRLAVSDATVACKISRWRDSNSIDTLAAAYAEIGDYDSALRYEQQAMAVAKLKPARGATSPMSMKLVEDHVALFKQQRPIRDPQR